VIDLHVFRAARLEEAAVEARRVLAEADAVVAAELESARRTAEAIIREARAEGVSDAERELELGRARGQRRARGIVLAARRDAYEHLREGALAAAFERRGTPGYAALVDRLERRVAAQLGDAARIERDPPDLGGLRAEAGGRRVDCSLGALVDRALRDLGREVETLWA
jgi:vacuolar-type H+-ATPase subunit E/Vma4